MKPTIILAIACILLLWLILAIPCNAQNPRNIQCKVFEVTKNEGGKVECKALSMEGDTIHLRIGYHSFGGGRNRTIKQGTWLTVYADYNDKKCEWITTKIKINK